jgi:UDP-N-acetylglucosamine 2-epimerase (non-hydrolysing)
MIRQAHERPEGMDEGTLIMSGLNKDRIIESIEIVTKLYKENKIPSVVDDYNVDNVSQKVLKIIFSYIDFINNNIWRKDSNQKSI